MTVRVCVPDDRQMLDAVQLAMAMWDESPVYGAMAKDLDRMVEFAYNARADAKTFCNVAVDRHGSVCGFLIGSLAPYGFHDSAFAYDRLVYVTPTARGGAAARMLIETFELWARDHDAVHVILGLVSGIHADTTERFYNKLGYATVGAMTMKELH